MKQARRGHDGKQREGRKEVRFDAYAHTSDLEEYERRFEGLINQVTKKHLKVSVEVWKEAGVREKDLE